MSSPLKNIPLLKNRSAIRYIIDTFRDKPYPKSDELSLSLAIEWIKNGAKRCGQKGVPYGYSLRRGWGESYPETTGYIIETLWDYYDISADFEARELAIKLTEWELEIQNENNGFPEGTKMGSRSEIFNTGMIIFGLVKSYEKTKDKRYIDAAMRAGDFIVNNQEPGGLWIRYSSSLVRNPIKSYHTRVSWALLRLYQVTNEARYKNSALRNLERISSDVFSNFWIPNMDFDSSGKPLTHSMCYTYRGMFESGVLLGEEKYIKIALTACQALIFSYERYGYLAVNYNPDWSPANRYKGLVGSAQFAALFFRICQIANEKKFFDYGREILEFVKSYQPYGFNDDGINGGLAGSIPANANYFPLTFLNWGAKFLADAIMLKLKSH